MAGGSGTRQVCPSRSPIRQPYHLGVTLYDVLGVSPGASGEEVRRAFVAMARRHHPDRHVGADDATRRAAERRMREVNDAWAVLGDPERRRRYDVSLSDRGPTARSEPTAGARSATAPPPFESERLRDWRSYASPGPGGAEPKPVWEQLVLMSPILLLLAAGLFGGAAALVGWEGFFATALVCLILAGAAFFMLPIWAMARTGRGRRRPPGRRSTGGR